MYGCTCCRGPGGSIISFVGQPSEGPTKGEPLVFFSFRVHQEDYSTLTGARLFSGLRSIKDHHDDINRLNSSCAVLCPRGCPSSQHEEGT